MKGDYDLTIIEPKNFFTYMPMGPATVCNEAAASRWLVEYSSNAKLAAHLKQGIVTGVASDGQKGEVTLQTGETLPFDYCVIASGAINTLFSPAPTQLTSKAEQVAKLESLRTLIKEAEKVVIVGGGPVGVEMAADISEAFAGKPITVVTSAPRLLDRMSEQASEYAAKWMETKGITTLYGERIQGEMQRCLSEACLEQASSASSLLQKFQQTFHLPTSAALPRPLSRFSCVIPCFVADWGSVQEAPVTATVVTEKGTSLTGLVIRCTGVRPATALFGSSLGAAALTPAGSVVVLPTLQLPTMPNVFAAGDVASSGEEKTANMADYAGTVVAGNIKALDAGKELQSFPSGLFGGHEKMPMMSGASLGSKDGVMQLGSDVTTGGSVISMNNFFAKLISNAVAGYWFWGFAYTAIKKMFIGTIASAAKKANAAAPAPAAE